MKWSKQQSACIEHKDHPIIVSASAGAGKTAVLTERIAKRCLIDGIDMNRIVALTFTAAAANEMKERIHKRLVQEKNNHPEKSELIEKQLTFLQEAQISTIHSFCLNIIKKYGYLIGFDQQRINRLFSDVSLKILKSNAFERTISVLDTQTLTTISEYFSTKPGNFTALQEMLTALLDQANNQCNPVESIKSIALPSTPIKSFDDLCENLKQNYKVLVQHYIQLIKSNIHTLKMNASEKYLKKQEPKIEALLTFLDSLQQYLDDETYSEIEQLYRYGFKGKLTVSKANNNPYESQTSDAINKLCDQLINSTAINQLINDQNAIIPVSHALSKTLEIYREMFELCKQEENGIDFNDMEYYAFKILDENPSVALYYKNYFQEICVDEFQDTSVRQNAIIEHISNGKNIFRVGDIKQSIYRFRQASPQLMKSLMEDGKNEVIILEENYRSSASVIEFTNHLFSKLMNIGLPNNQYLSSDNVTPGTEQQKKSYLPIEFYGLDTQSFKELKLTNSNTNRASTIVALIEENRKKSQFKHYKDYCVLVRSHTSMHFLKNEFEKASIPYKMDLKNGFSNNSFIQTIRAFFTLVLDNKDPLALTIILTSPYYNYSLQQLYDGKYNNSLSYKKDTQELLQFISHLTQNISKGMNFLLSEILAFKTIYQRLKREDRFNVDYLIQLLQTNTVLTVMECLTLLDSELDQDSSQILGIGKDDDVVTVMTIHQSKGLQFPCVILWSDSKNNDPDTTSLINWDNDFQLGLKALHLPGRLTHPSLSYAYNRLCNSNEDLAERIRLLYVAITRAKEKLLIVDMVSSVPEVHPYTLADIYLRKGFTYDILSTCQTNQLFEFKHIYTPLPTVTNSTTSTPPFPIMTYANKNKSIVKESASKLVQTHEFELIQNKDGLNYGTQLHEVLQALDYSSINNELLTQYNPSLTKSMRLQLVQAAQTFHEFAMSHGILQWLKELPFLYQEDSVLYSGSIDAVGISNSTIYIIDYKTTNADIATLKSMYNLQLKTYAKVMQKAYPQLIIKCYLYSFKHNCLIEI